MIHSRFFTFGACLLAWLTASGAARKPLGLHPDNPHYFLFRGKPTILITSGEHYGAVLNLDFDYVKYLATLRKEGMNLTRTFSGAYVEPPGAFNISRNTLAPAPLRFIAPWARSDTPGYANGGNKFDLHRWNPTYFQRLIDFASQAGKRGVIVEMNLFCPFYDEPQWRLSPMNAANNVNGLGTIARTNVYTLDRHGGLLAVHEALTRKVVAELKGFDNVYYEICNEPYFGGVSLSWQHRIAEVIQQSQASRQHRSLISQNIANGSQAIQQPHPAVSIFNFHYAAPPDAIAQNYGLAKVIGDNETGFRGTNDAPYRMESWDFIIAGGGLFNHLDYSFAVGHEDGSFIYPSSQPGGGNPVLRRQFRILRDFIHGFRFWEMRPENSILKGGLTSRATARALVNPGKEYAIYLRSAPLPSQFSARWSGEVQPEFSEEYTFHTLSNDGVRLWIDGRQVIDNWTEHSTQEDTGQMTLQAGRRYSVKLEYFFAGGSATMKLFWSSRSQPKEIIPSRRLSSPKGEAGLKGEYYADMSLQALRESRLDPAVNFDWAADSGTGVAFTENQIALALELPAGDFRTEWVNTRTGAIERPETFRHAGGTKSLNAPAFQDDIALRIQAVNRRR